MSWPTRAAQRLALPRARACTTSLIGNGLFVLRPLSVMVVRPYVRTLARLRYRVSVNTKDGQTACLHQSLVMRSKLNLLCDQDTTGQAIVLDATPGSKGAAATVTELRPAWRLR